MTILLWTGAILWLILSTVAVTFLAYISGRLIYFYCNFQPVVRDWGSESMTYENLLVLYWGAHATVYSLALFLVGNYCMAGVIRLDIKIALLDVLLIDLAVQGTLHS